ncbi:MAG: hypothetical protein SOX60_05930 [Prevotella sp.]|nr:hypothetical protein [Prevotella sp.]MDY3284034.1 hypothetical protein [Prevotella sp.]MDY5927860.1 hypothetical protein [Prevotella sp.]
MTLLDLFKKYSADELLATIDEMFPDTEKFHNTFREAYNLMMTLTPIASKKKITYKILSDEENDIEFFGAEDSCFNTTWEVCLAKELVVEKGVELSDIEIAANSLVNMCLIGRCPRAFLPQKRELLNEAEQE